MSPAEHLQLQSLPISMWNTQTLFCINVSLVFEFTQLRSGLKTKDSVSLVIFCATALFSGMGFLSHMIYLVRHTLQTVSVSKEITGVCDTLFKSLQSKDVCMCVPCIP